MKNYPINYIHEPWKAPEQVQKAAKCIVGVDYPKPMIDHEFFAKQNQERMRQVYQTLSTYRNLKTPATPEDDDDCISNVQSQTTSSNTSNNLSSSILSQEQKIEQQKLMPAPLHIPQQQQVYNTNSVSQNHQQNLQQNHQQNLHQNHQQSLQHQSLQSQQSISISQVQDTLSKLVGVNKHFK